MLHSLAAARPGLPSRLNNESERIEFMENQLLELLAKKDYAPATAPELLQLLRLSPDRESQLNRVLRQLERKIGRAHV